MKTFKALFIDSGVIKVGEFPVEPEKPVLHPEDYDGLEDYHYQLSQYRSAFASAKANAVPCEDQAIAKKIIKDSYGHDLDHMTINTEGYEYRLPSGWGYRVEIAPCERCSRDCYNFQMRDCKDRKVAILYRTDEFEKFTTMDNSPTVASDRTTQQPEPEETEDSIWAEILFNARWYDGTPHHLKSITECLKERFTITRRK